MPVTIRIFGRWTARVEDGIWCVREGPPEIATMLNAIANVPPAAVHVDEQRLREARVMYPGLQVLPRYTVAGPTIH